MSVSPNIQIVEETGSTNADLAEALRRGDTLREGRWLVARRQTAGRGRQGRDWFDGSGNFMGSTLVALRRGDPPPASLGFAVALAVSAALGQLVDNRALIRAKWPNDVLLGGGKVCGILLEWVEGCLVVGVGINLARAPEIARRKTAALADYAPPPSLEDFAAAFASAFESELAKWRTDGLAPTLRDFLQSTGYEPGTPITVHDTDGSRVEGHFAGLEPEDGALRLRLADGSERVIRAGDID